MKILIAPDKFKGSLGAKEVALAIEKGVERVLPRAETILCPMADGGEGTVETLVSATGGEIVPVRATGPLGKPVDAYFGILLRTHNLPTATCVIEMAAASGLRLTPESKRNPMLTTTYGTGELIRAALDHGCREIIIGIGDSATNDGGMGMAQALGARFFDGAGKELGLGRGELLRKIAKIDVSGLDPRLGGTEIIVASDVDNPLCGPHGAAHVFAPQKGATPGMVEELDEGLAHYAEIIQRDLGKNIGDIPGSGAAGGLGAGLIAFLNARIRSGVELIIETVGLEARMRGADLVITGEGKMDIQTIRGKTPIGVAGLAAGMGIPTIAIVGQVGDGVEAVYDRGITEVFPLMDVASSLEEAMNNTAKLIEVVAERAMKSLKGRAS
ncbi:MAG TPA: glycerate kinase [Actinobacteria bacterium]|nr:glycerate kinase [Actinomycetota bacterium]